MRLLSIYRDQFMKTKTVRKIYSLHNSQITMCGGLYRDFHAYSLIEISIKWSKSGANGLTMSVSIPVIKQSRISYMWTSRLFRSLKMFCDHIIKVKSELHSIRTWADLWIHLWYLLIIVNVKCYAQSLVLDRLYRDVNKCVKGQPFHLFTNQKLLCLLVFKCVLLVYFTSTFSQLPICECHRTSLLINEHSFR